VKLGGVLLTVLVAVMLQVTLARFTVGGRWTFDLVLVGVVYAALNWGPVAGIVAGTVGGLLQDALSSGVVGVGGLAKTLVGFAAGEIGGQFVLVRPQGRMLVVALASIVHRGLVLLLYALIDQHWPGVQWTAILGETVINAGCGLLAFQAAQVLPGLAARGRAGRRSTLSRRRW
jgi:rod shape-determining protein MreD